MSSGNGKMMEWLLFAPQVRTKKVNRCKGRPKKRRKEKGKASRLEGLRFCSKRGRRVSEYFPSVTILTCEGKT